MTDDPYAASILWLTIFLIILFSFVVTDALHQSCVFSAVLISSISCLFGIIFNVVANAIDVIPMYESGQLKAGLISVRAAAIFGIVAILPGLFFGESFSHARVDDTYQIFFDLFLSAVNLSAGSVLTFLLAEHSRSKVVEAPDGSI